MADITLGMIGSGRWSNDERPKSYREGILFMMPNGNVPLTAISSKGRSSEKLSDPSHYYYSKDMPVQGGACTGVYKNEALSSAYAAGDSAAAGTTVFAKVGSAIAQEFIKGQTVLLVDKDYPTKESFGKVLGRTVNGADSYVAIMLRGASAVGNLNAADYIDIIGNVHPEGGPSADAISYGVDKFETKAQIMKNALEITNTQKNTKLRIGDLPTEEKREKLLLHGMEIENSAMFSWMTEVNGEKNQKERTMRGILEFIRTYAPADHESNYRNESLSWLNGGQAWFNERMKLLFGYGRNVKMALCGNTALLGINDLAQSSSQFNLTPETGTYGVNVYRWRTPFGDLLLKHAPMLSYRGFRSDHVICYEPENVRFRYLRDTNLEEVQGDFDGQKWQYITEGCFEYHFPRTFMLLTGVGVNPGS